MARSGRRKRRQMAYSAISGRQPGHERPICPQDKRAGDAQHAGRHRHESAVSPNALRYTTGSSVRISKSPTPMLTAPHRTIGATGIVGELSDQVVCDRKRAVVIRSYNAAPPIRTAASRARKPLWTHSAATLP